MLLLPLHVHIHELLFVKWFDLSTADEIKPREITPGGFDTPAAFELNFSVEMVDGVVRLISNQDESQKVGLQTSRLYAKNCELHVYFVQAELSEEEKAVLDDEVLNTPDFFNELRQEFVENLNTLKALSAHGPV